MQILIHSFVTSKLDFCNSLLFGLPKYEVDKLQMAQNAAARVIAKLRKYDHISQTLRDLHWLPIQERIIFKINLLSYKVLHDMAPQYLKELIRRYEPRRQLRSSSDKWRLEKPRYKLESYGLRAFRVAAPKLWNKLPFGVRSADVIEQFKSKLKTYLFKIAYNL